jgi:hypothetical protein
VSIPALLELVGPWHLQTFGRLSLGDRLRKLSHELDELEAAGPETRAEEAADVAIVLLGLCYTQPVAVWPLPLRVGHIYAMKGDVESMAGSLVPGTDWYRSGDSGWVFSEAASLLLARLELFVAAGGGDLEQAIKAKMAVNRARRWERDSSGWWVRVTEAGGFP